MKKSITVENSVVISLFDKVAEVYGSPTTFVNVPVAERSFEDLLKTDMYSGHKGDYAIYQIATFNAKNGDIIPLNKPKLLKDGASYVKDN